MSGVLRHWQQPEWSARSLWDFAESVKAKVHEYNPSADDWRLLRVEDVPGGVAGSYWNTVAMPIAQTWYTMIPGALGVAAAFRVPAGLGLGIFGFWISGPDLGIGAGYRVLVNGVKRVECPIHEFMADSKGANKAFDTGVTGYVYYFHVSYVHLDQLVFARENDQVDIQLKGANAMAIGDFEFFPKVVLAGHSKQLLISA